MKFLRFLALFVFAFFEIYAGIRLMSNPVAFTDHAIILFGAIMLIVGIVSLIRALDSKSKGFPYQLQLTGAIIDLVIGVICVAFSKYVVALFPVLALIYGVFMVVMGINKLRHFSILKDLGFKRVWLILLSAILTIVLGVIIFLNPFTTTEVAWNVIGIFLMVEGIADLLSGIFGLFF